MTTSRSSFTAMAPLTRFEWRRDRVRIAVWILAILVVVISTVASVKGLYPTQADLDTAAAASEDNAAAIIFNGPPQGLDTVGGQVAFQTGTFGLILMGLMSIFMLARATRGEEEAGRSELLRSLPLGDHALPGAALLTVTAMNVATGALVALALAVLGLPATGSVVFGLSFTAFGLLLTAVTLIAAQVTENTRVVYGIGGLVLGMSFVMRAVGDIGDGTVSWLSPIGWAQKTRPYAGEAWWPFVIIMATTALLAWGASVLSRHRDIGAGLVAPRAGRVHAAPSLGSPIGLATRIQRGAFIGWGAGLVVLAVAYGSITDSIHEFVKDNKSLADIVAAQGQGTIVEQYLAMSFRILALVSAAFAIQAVQRIRNEEMNTRAELVLATAVSRIRFAASHLALSFGGTLVILAVAGAGFGVSDAIVTGDPDAMLKSFVGMIVFTPAVWLLAAFTIALVGTVPRASAWSWALLGVCFVIGFFGQLLDLPQWIVDLSPFQHVPQYPAAALTASPLVLLVAVSAALTAVGLGGLRRRDIG
jgi:ABC-2 type transport system permease protein